MRRLIYTAIMLAASTATLIAGAVTYKPEAFRDPATVAKKYLNCDLKRLKKLNIDRLVILECYGEFVVSKEVTDRQLGIYKSQGVDVDKDYYTYTADRVFQALVRAFENNGVAIVTKEEIRANPTFREWNLQEEREGRGVTAGLYKPTKVEESQKISTSGLGLFPSNPLAMIKVIMKLAQVTAELGADGLLQVRFKVDMGKKYAPVLSELEIKMSSDLTADSVGLKGHRSVSYGFKSHSDKIVLLKEPIKSEADVKSDKKGQLDLDKYDAELMGIMNALVAGIDHALKEQLPGRTPVVRQQTEEASSTPPEE